MDASTFNPKLAKFLRYLSAYAWFVFFLTLALAITWCLRSDILILFLIFSVPKWITGIISTWGVFVMLIPFILMIGGLEPYMNTAAQKRIVLKNALKVLWIEGGIGLVIAGVMGVLALAGYPPTF